MRESKAFVVVLIKSHVVVWFQFYPRKCRQQPQSFCWLNNNEIPCVILLQRFVKYKGLFHQSINALVSGRCICEFKFVIFKLIPRRDTSHISCETGVSTLVQTMVQTMASCRQATSHNPSHCWPYLCRHMAIPGHNALTKSANGSMGLSRWKEIIPGCI